MADHKPKLTIRNPASQAVLTELETDDSVSIIEKFNRAMAAQLQWALKDANHRENIITRFLELLKENATDLSRNMAEESGKPIRDCLLEIQQALHAGHFYLKNYKSAISFQEDIIRNDRVQRLSADPLGVIAHIAGFDLSVLTAINVFVPALLTGNAILYKPSVFACLSGLSLVELLYQAGLHDELLIPVLGDSFAAQELLKWPLNAVFFTGSYKTGQQIADICAQRFTSLQMELNGNNAAYVCADCDMQMTVQSLAEGVLYHCGQSRLCVGRIYVESTIYKQFVGELQKAMAAFQPGDPLDSTTRLGPLKYNLNLAPVLQQVMEQGGQVLESDCELPVQGNYCRPAILLDVDPSHSLMEQAIRGPYVSVTPVGADFEAIHYINDSSFGMYSSVYTADSERARQVLSNALTGIVCHNSCMEISPYLPRNVRRSSGVGVSMGRSGIRSFVQQRSWFLEADEAVSGSS